MSDQAVAELAPVVGVKAACEAVGRPRATHYRHHRQSPPPPKPERARALQPRALDEVERKEVLGVLHAPDHVDEAPATGRSQAVVATTGANASDGVIQPRVRRGRPLGCDD